MLFRSILGDGSAFGLEGLSYAVQENAGGIAEALGLGERFSRGGPVVVMLADNIFDAVKTEVTPKGTVETVPKTEEDWEKVRIGGVSMVETAELLKMVRPFTPPGDKNNSEGPDAVELSPEEIMAKVQKDPVEWNARIQALKNVGLATIELANKKDVAALWDASENLDEACENCHRSYWYPKENLDFYGKLDKRLRDKVTESQREGGKTPAAPKK